MDERAKILHLILTEVSEHHPEGLSTAHLYDLIDPELAQQFGGTSQLSAFLRAHPTLFRSRGGCWRAIGEEESQPSQAEPVPGPPVGINVAGPRARIELEADLRTRMLGRRIVAEIGLDAALFEELRDLIEAETSHGLAGKQLAQMLGRSSPHILVSYLVGHGVYGYQDGDFWTHCCLDASAGPFFERALRDLSLETFEDMVVGDNALRYVGPILAHGGIPKASLDDYFGLLARDSRRIDGAAVDLLAHWRARKSAFAGIDEPVRRFLQFGGDIAVDFLDRCLDLLRATREGREPRLDEVGLPPYVFLQFRRFSKKTPLGSVESGRTRAERPRVVLDPWTAIGPQLELPPVRRELSSAFWRVQSESDLQRIEASLSETRRTLLRPARSWSVELNHNGRVVQEYVFEGIDAPHSPAALFDAERGTLHPMATAVRSESVLVLRPSTVVLKGITHSGEFTDPHVTEELPAPTGSWSGYELAEISTVGLRALSIGSGAPKDRRLTIRPQADRPHLVGDALAGVTAENGLPVYAAAPAVVFPGVEGVDTSLWNVRLTVNGEERAVRVGDAASSSVLELVDYAAVGEISVVRLAVTGPLGSDLRTSFVVFPGLRVARPERIVVPGKVAHVAAVAPGLAFNSEPPSALCHAEVPEGHDDVEMAVVDLFDHAVSVRVRVPKLLWSERLGNAGVGRRSETALHWLADDILSGHVVALSVLAGEPDVPLALELRAGSEVVQEAVRARTGRDGRWIFDLTRYRDSIRLSDASALELVLLVGTQAFTVGRIRPTFEARNIRVVTRIQGDDTHVEIAFDQGRRVRDRVVRFWSLDRPWAAPVVEQIPDDHEGLFEIRDHGRIPAGDYLLELAIDDGWTEAVRPRRDSPQAQRITVGGRGDLEMRLEQLPAADPYAVLEYAGRTGHAFRRLEGHEIAKICPSVLDFALWFIDEESMSLLSGQRFRTIISLLLIDGEAFATACVESYERGACTASQLDRLGLVIGSRLLPRPPGEIGDGTMRSLWGIAPVIASGCDLRSSRDAVPINESALDQTARAEEFLGIEPRKGAAQIKLCQPVSQLWIGMPAEQLGEIQRTLELVPKHLLDADALIAAILEWLARAKGDEAAVVGWWKHYLEFACPDAAPTALAAQHLAARVPPTGTAPWAGVPGATLGAALALFSQPEDPRVATEALLAAYAFAPKLVRRDLILARVLLNAEAHPS